MPILTFSVILNLILILLVSFDASAGRHFLVAAVKVCALADTSSFIFIFAPKKKNFFFLVHWPW